MIRHTTAALVAMALLPLGAGAQEVGQDDTMTVVEHIGSDPQFSLLSHAINQAGLEDALTGEGPYTVFAPTNAAFESLGEGALEPYMQDPQKLAELLKGHVVPGPVKVTDPDVETEIETMAGDTLSYKLTGEQASVGDATIVDEGITASNGVVHVIDQVLIDGQ